MVTFVELLESVNRQLPTAGRRRRTHTHTLAADNQVLFQLEAKACGVLIVFSKEKQAPKLTFS